MTTSRRMLVTSALPYANGHLHLGHLVEHIQTDIWVRVHQMLGHQCISICADDAHGTPIMLKAEQMGVAPETMTASFRESHENDLNAFQIKYDFYHTTHSPENQALANQIYLALSERGDISKAVVHQAFDPVKEMFLPDRYVKGNCPRCNAADQYGDSCEQCSATYSPSELKNPISVVSGVPPIFKDSEHYFFDLAHYETLLKSWTKEACVQPEVVNKLEEWLSIGLKPWDISRDSPYFGFLIPGCTDKYFYVWLDAPVGYMASFKAYCDKTGTDFDAFWGADATAELYHFVGKDIIYFHALFWPAMLSGAGFRLPTALFAHGFLTVNGQKMSKSRGTFIEAQVFRAHLNPTYLRYYFATKLNGHVEDLDLSMDDFCQRVNADLVGKVVNIASRCSSFIQKYFDLQLSTPTGDLITRILSQKDAIIAAYVERDFARAMRLIMQAADWANQYVDTCKPWVLAKEEATRSEVQAICTTALNAFKILIGYLKPVLPEVAEQSEAFLACPPLTFDNLSDTLCDHAIKPFTPLLQRVDVATFEAMLLASKESMSNG